MLINNCRLAGYLMFVARIKFGVTGQVSNPQSATIHSTNVIHNIKLPGIFILTIHFNRGHRIKIAFQFI